MIQLYLVGQLLECGTDAGVAIHRHGISPLATVNAPHDHSIAAGLVFLLELLPRHAVHHILAAVGAGGKSVATNLLIVEHIRGKILTAGVTLDNLAAVSGGVRAGIADTELFPLNTAIDGAHIPDGERLLAIRTGIVVFLFHDNRLSVLFCLAITFRHLLKWFSSYPRTDFAGRRQDQSGTTA